MFYCYKLQKYMNIRMWKKPLHIVKFFSQLEKNDLKGIAPIICLKGLSINMGISASMIYQNLHPRKSLNRFMTIQTPRFQLLTVGADFFQTELRDLWYLYQSGGNILNFGGLFMGWSIKS